LIAATVPIIHTGYKTKTAEEKAATKRAVFIFLNTSTLIAALVSMFFFKSMVLALSFFFISWLLWLWSFLKSSPNVTRHEIALFVIDSMLLCLMTGLTTIEWVLTKLLQ
jgi:hypothetical protein